MSRTFLIADTHFGHNNMCVFTDKNGNPIRPWNSAEEMDIAMIELWNDTVQDNDKVYVLGDAVIGRKHLSTFGKLNGKKVLIKGNHDIFKLTDYTPYFYDIRGYHVMNGLILSHIPIHAESLGRFGCNIHGHLHSNRVMTKVPYKELDGPGGSFGYQTFYKEGIDPRYFCVSAEHTEFKPMLFDDVCQAIIDQGGEIGFKNGNGPTM